ncbi:MAG: hypothetical protein HGA76_04510 [Candidatus Firestonebacteria bacterium]|nr:hypothetical protein [Candidatus Firestonebacteria bacterium]
MADSGTHLPGWFGGCVTVHQIDRGTLSRRLTDSLFYVLGLAAVYTVLGMVAALTGNMFGAITTNPWIYLGFGIFLLAIGGSMMDWYGLPFLTGASAGADKWRERPRPRKKHRIFPCPDWMGKPSPCTKSRV